MYDTAVIGTGPAGLSAVLTLELHEKNIIWFGSRSFSNKVRRSEKIANYPGIPFVSGDMMNAAFSRQIEQMGIEITEKMVTNVMKRKDHYMILAGNDIYEARTVLLATGVATQRDFEGEDRLLGRGVSYCATCDGFLYKGKAVAVFCGSRRYEHEVEYLAGLADKVYLAAPYKDCSVILPNVERITAIKEVRGDTKVESVVLYSGTEIPVSALFCLRDAVAPEKLAAGLECEGPHISVDRSQKTNLPGCYAAGDCTGRPYQIAKAVGEGNVAAHSIINYLDE